MTLKSLVYAVLFLATLAQSQTIYSGPCPDPNGCAYTVGSPLIDSKGNLWFEQYGLPNTIIELTAPNFTASTLYTFPSTVSPNPTPLVRDSLGNFYGVATNSSGRTIIYKVTSKGIYSTFYTFAPGTKAPGLYHAASGDFYGYSFTSTTSYIYRLTSKGEYSTLHTFLTGNFPVDVPIINSNGNLYGVATGGTYGYGFIFERTSAGKYSVLWNFTGGANGAIPTGKLTQVAGGTMYAVTGYGGNLTGYCLMANNGAPYDGCGTIFSVTSTGAFATVYEFPENPGDATGGNIRVEPYGAITIDTEGNFYVATTAFGDCFFDLPCGPQVFQVTAAGLNGLACIDGPPYCGQGDALPGVVLDKNNNLYFANSFLGCNYDEGCFDSYIYEVLFQSGWLNY